MTWNDVVKTRFVVILVLAIGVLFSSLSFAAIAPFGKSVELRLGFHLDSDKSDDTIETGEDYTLVNDNVVLGIIYAGSTSYGSVNESYNATDHLIRQAQANEDNRFLITLTSGTLRTVKQNVLSIEGSRIPDKTFGSLATEPREMAKLFIRLEYDDINLTNATTWAPGSNELMIYNNGTDERGRKIVTIERR